MENASDPSATLVIGHFHVVPYRRELSADGRSIKLGGRAFDVLMALIDARGAVVSKHALMARVWPDRVVDENNLQSQISALRTAFGAERELIRTVAGRGYQFTGEVRVLPREQDDRAGLAPETETAPPPTNLPQLASELIGRDEAMHEILRLAAAHRFVTLTGAGGIGKTRLAFGAGRRLLPTFEDGVHVADLAPLAEAGLVPAVVAAAIGFEPGAGAVSPERVAGVLGAKRLLLVLDNCEHVIDAAAGIAHAILSAAPGVHVIATSREPLRVEGEQVYPVPPLGVPADDAEVHDDVLQYGAVRLFLERTRAAGPQISMDRQTAAIVAAVCRRLDGIPLAIELAAARAAALGIEGVAKHLDDRFQLLTGGRRTALPRHQTLRATLDWSYELLTGLERVLLRRLAIFAGSFGFSAAGAVAADSDLLPADVAAALSNLVEKSLVAVELYGGVALYRLLETTRAYGLAKLDESGERESVARRYAEYYRDLFEGADSEAESVFTSERLIEPRRQIENVRAALDWSFSPAGDALIGVALTAGAVPLWMHLSLVDECRGRVEQALAAAPGGPSDPRRTMKLHAALATTLTWTRGVVVDIGELWTGVLETAESLDDVEYQLRARWGLWFFESTKGRHRVALAHAEKLGAVSARWPDPNDRLVREKLIGMSHHVMGDQPRARHHIEPTLSEPEPPIQTSLFNRYLGDPRVVGRVYLARVLWLQGFPDAAMRMADASIEKAHAINHSTTFCYALALAACPIALLCGNATAAERYVGLLLDRAGRHGLAFWQAWGRSNQAVLAIKHGDVNQGLRLLRATFEGPDSTSRLRIGFLGEMAEALRRVGQVADGLAAIGEALARVERTEARWLIADLMRIKGELILAEGARGAEEAAADCFGQALDWARRQGALSWELRVATSAARALRAQDRAADAKEILQPVYDRFTEGFETADLEMAKTLLDTLQLGGD